MGDEVATAAIRCVSGRGLSGKAKTPEESGVCGGERYWDRTSDLFRVREARYRCANRSYVFSCPSEALKRLKPVDLEVGTGFEPA